MTTSDISPAPDAPPPPARRAILILGMHRSGTSALGGAIHALGATAPATLPPPAPENPRGFWESAVITRLNDAILAACDSTWDDWRPIDTGQVDSAAHQSLRHRMAQALQTEFGQAPLLFLKDPRLSRLLSFWQPVFAEQEISPSALIALRHPLAVANSLVRRNGVSRELGLLLWLRYMLDAELHTRTLPRAIVSYDALLADWRRTLTSAGGRMAVNWPVSTTAAAPEIEAFLDHRLRHAEAGPSAYSSAYGEVWTRHVWNALSEMERAGDTPETRAALDRVRSQFDDACRLFGPATSSRPAAPAVRPARPDLRRVTLCVADSATAALAARAIEVSVGQADFAGATLFTDLAISGSFRTCPIRPLASREAYGGFILKDLIRYVDSDFVLVAQWDGYVIDPGAWDDDFLRFDYIGARWGRYSDGMDVGNGGFSLRSRRLLEALQDTSFAPTMGASEDELVCRIWRPTLERDFGIRFAPDTVAERFSYERLLPSLPTFGFHGMFNFWRHLDDQALDETVALLPREKWGSREFVELVAMCFLNHRSEPLRSLAGLWVQELSSEEIGVLLRQVLQDEALTSRCLKQAGLA